MNRSFLPFSIVPNCSGTPLQKEYREALFGFVQGHCTIRAEPMHEWSGGHAQSVQRLRTIFMVACR